MYNEILTEGFSIGFRMLNPNVLLDATKTTIQRRQLLVECTDNGGVAGYIQRGLLYPENQLIAAELSEGTHRLQVTRRP